MRRFVKILSLASMRVGLLSVATTCVVATPAPADDATTQPADNGQKRIMIAPFEDLSSSRTDRRGNGGYYPAPQNLASNAKDRFDLYDRFSDAPRAELEEILVNLDGVTIVERQRVDQILQEHQFGGLAGIADPATAAKAGKAVGATTIIIGTVTNLVGSKKEFHGNDVDVIDYTATATVLVRVIDIEKATIIASKRLTGSKTTRLQTENRYTNDNDPRDHEDTKIDAIRDAMDTLTKDKGFIAKLTGGGPVAASTIKIEISPAPPNADVLIDDAYQGNAPMTIDVPAGKTVKITLRKAGYADWQASMMPRDGMKVSPEMEKK